MDEFSSGLSEQQLKYGYWYATHQLLVRRMVLVIAWITLIIMGLFVTWNALDWGVIGGMRERAGVLGLVGDKADFAGAAELRKPRDLSVTNTLSLPGGEGKVDFVSTIKNTNAEWAAMLSYRFAYGSAETPILRGFVLPGEEVILPAYGIADTGSVQPIFRAQEIHWMRVMPHTVGKYAPFAAARLRFETGVPQMTFVELGGKRISKTSFTFTNRSAYSFWHVPVDVMLDTQGVVSAMQTVVLDAVKAGESREVEVSWFYDVPAGATPRVIPRVNILDPGVYMPLN